MREPSAGQGVDSHVSADYMLYVILSTDTFILK